MAHRVGCAARSRALMLAGPGLPGPTPILAGPSRGSPWWACCWLITRAQRSVLALCGGRNLPARSPQPAVGLLFCPAAHRAVPAATDHRRIAAGADAGPQCCGQPQPSAWENPGLLALGPVQLARCRSALVVNRPLSRTGPQSAKPCCSPLESTAPPCLLLSTLPGGAVWGPDLGDQPLAPAGLPWMRLGFTLLLRCASALVQGRISRTCFALAGHTGREPARLGLKGGA